MLDLVFVDGSFAVRLTVTLLHFLWQGCLLGVVALAGAALFGRISAKVRYAVHLSAMLAMLLCLPVTWLAIGDYDRISKSAGHSEQHPVRPSANVDSESTLSFESDRSIGALLPGKSEALIVNRKLDRGSIQGMQGAEANAPGIEAVVFIDQLDLATVSTWSMWSYFGGLFLMTIRLVSGLCGGHRLRRSGFPVGGRCIQHIVRDQAASLGLRISPAVAYCREISIPIVVGVVRPMILLPASLASGLSPEQLQAVITHELAHIRRFDLLVNLVQRAIEVALFFHPAVWLVSRRASLERENIADDIVVATGWSAERYADALVRMAELSSSQRHSSLANQVATLAATGVSGSDFKRRVLRLLDQQRTPQLRLTRAGVAMTATVCGVLLLTPFVFPLLAEAPPSEASRQTSTDAPDNEAVTDTDDPVPQDNSLQCFVFGDSKALPDAVVKVQLAVAENGEAVLDAVSRGRVLKEMVYRTGSDGAYEIAVPAELAELPSLAILATVSHPEFLDRTVSPVPFADFKSEGVEKGERLWLRRQLARQALLKTRLRKGRIIHGRVLLPDGTPAVGASVRTATKYRPYSWKHFSADDYGFAATTKTDEAGNFSLEADKRSSLTVTHTRQATLLVDDLKQYEDELASESEFVLRLPQPIRLRGRVLSDSGEPVPRAIIVATRKFDWDEFDMPLSYRTSCVSNEKGEYQLPALPADEYRITAVDRLSDEIDIEAFNAHVTGESPLETDVVTQPLSVVFSNMVTTLKNDQPFPRFDLKAEPMAVVLVRMEFPDGPPDPKRGTDVGIVGKLNGDNWYGPHVRAAPNGLARLIAPKGLTDVRIKTGTAKHRRSPDGELQIGRAIHYERIDGNLDGITVIRPELARLRIKLTLSDRLKEFRKQSKARLAIRVVYVRKGFSERSPIAEQQPLSNSYRSETEYRALALPDERISVTIRLKHDDKETLLYEDQFTLSPGEVREKPIAVDYPGRAVAAGGNRTSVAAEERQSQSSPRKKSAPSSSPMHTAGDLLQKARSFLLSRQRADGSWPCPDDRYLAGTTSLVGLALQGSGSSSDAALRRARDFVAKAPAEHTKEIALQAMFLRQTGDNVRLVVRRNLRWLLEAQITTGPDTGGWGYLSASQNFSRADLANSAYAILALTECESAADESSKQEIDKACSEALQWLLQTQQSDGGWGYVPRSRSAVNMTACAIACLKALKARTSDMTPKVDQALRSGKSWLTERWGQAVGQSTQPWQLFGLSWLSLALEGDKQFATRDWREEIHKRLAAMQAADGSFPGKASSSNAVVSTAFAIQSLSLQMTGDSSRIRAQP